jgi:predicted helicase
MLKAYLKKLFDTASHGDSTEVSYYSTLEKLLREYADSIGRKDVQITTLPKKTEAGNPDFRIWDGKQHIVGYIEAKAPTILDLDEIEESAQLKRYLHTFPNLILTNFFEFRLYRNGSLIDEVTVARPFIIHKLKTVPPIEKEAEFQSLLEKFLSFSIPKVYDAKTLAVELANRTRFLRDEVVTRELEEEEKTAKGIITGFYEAFRQFLINGLTKKEFADLYSQTITYGLFASRTRSENGFNRKLAYDNIPHTIGILRDVFRFISVEDPPPQMEWIIDDISEVLAVTDVKNILHQYFHEGKGKDPIVHFYETFLAVYDKETREKRGVYYTPEPVVSYIVRSLDIILKEHLERPDGFASSTVTVLDPAAGTLTFLAEASKLAVEEFVAKYGEGGKENFIKEHILRDFYAFELMMAPYAVGHLKMSFLLEELGYKLQKDDRFKLYLTNTLEMEELAQTELPGMASLSEESHLAGKVKKETPILVILGNPPYSGHSANASEKFIVQKKGSKARRRKIKTWIGNLIEDYKLVDGKPLGEKNPKWLQDDYVKFIRFAQWKIEQEGEGVLGFITNHSYLDNPTFRGMRHSLMNSFNEIYILDLHGNSLKKEKCPDGSKDENVFDIQQGVTIALFIKKISQIEEGGKVVQAVMADNKRTDRDARSPDCRIYHSEIWGIRQKKNSWLLGNEIKTTNWCKLSPKSGFYLFVPRDERLLDEYEKHHKISEIFALNSIGLFTARDNFVIDTNKENLLNRIQLFKNNKYSDDDLHTFFQLNRSKGWDVRKAWKAIQSISESDLNRLVISILYRPFDIRWIFYHDAFIERSRREVMRHMIQENLALCVGRAGQVVGLEKNWNIVFCSECIEDLNLFYRGGNVSFPLFLYPDMGKKDLFSHKKKLRERESNINPKILSALFEVYREEPTPVLILDYVYAVLYSNIYRTKYAEFLKTDFPRIPFTKDRKIFNEMAEFGKKLIDLHLLKSPVLDTPFAKFHGKGDNIVEKLKHENERVYINKDQYFEPIQEAIWEYQIGGYQVCEKWLKDRKGRKLSLDDIKHYCQIMTAIHQTIEIQKETDNIYPEVEKKTIEFES